MTESVSHLRVIEETPAYWRVVFDNPPLNIMDADMFEGLQDLLARMDASPSLRVVVFESANPDFYLAHFEVKDTARTLTLLKTVGPSGLPSLLDTFVRLTKSPVVSIAKIRGRARGVSSEFLLACDMRFASRENTALAQVEVGSGVHPGGGGPERRSVSKGCSSEGGPSGGPWRIGTANCSERSWPRNRVLESDFKRRSGMNLGATNARTRHPNTVGDGTENFRKDWGAGQPI